MVISSKYKMAVWTDYTSHDDFSAAQNKCSVLTKVCHLGDSFCFSLQSNVYLFTRCCVALTLNLSQSVLASARFSLQC